MLSLICMVIPTSTSQKIYPFYSHIKIDIVTYFPIIFFCINVSGMYLKKQEPDMYWFCYRYAVQILVIHVQGKQSVKVILVFSSS